MNILQSTFKEVNSYCELLSHQIQKYIGGRTHGSNRDIINDQYNESENEQNLFHKSTIEKVMKMKIEFYLISCGDTFFPNLQQSAVK